MRYLILLLTFFLFSLPHASSQTFKGKVISNTNEPIPHAIIYIRELAQGSSANELGDFAIKLKDGTFHCTFQSMGYEAKEVLVTMRGGDQTQEVILGEKPYMLDMSTASVGKSEDLAYSIMRKAIGMAPYHLNQVSEYTSTVYLKGSMEVKKISGLVKAMAKDEIKEAGVKEGETYFQESVNEVTFTAPDKYNQKVLSIASTFPQGMSELYFTHMNFSIYDTDIKLFISPLSPSAFSHYKFTYEGCAMEGDLLVNKVKITPKIKNQLTVSGYLYIVEDSWSVHEFDFSGEQSGVTYRNKQTFAQVRKDVFLPINYLFSFDVNILGNKGSINHQSVVKYTRIKPNPNAKKLAGAKAAGSSSIVPDKLDEKQQKELEKVEALLAKGKLSNRDAMKLAKLMNKAATETRKQQQEAAGTKKDPLLIERSLKLEVDSLARKRDSTFWVEARPIPLSEIEVKSYAQKGSLLQVAAKKDSISRRRPFTIGGLFLGKTYHLCDSSARIVHYGLIDPSAFYFHPADGYVYGQDIAFSKRFKDTTALTATLSGRYAFSRHKPMGTLNVRYSYLPERRALLEMEGGRKSADFQAVNKQSIAANTYSSLLAHRSYVSLYDDRFVSLFHSVDITNGLTLAAKATFSDRKQLDNLTEISYLYRSRTYRSNTPDSYYVERNPTIVSDAKSFVVAAALSYTPEYYYSMRGRTKRMVKSSYPTFTVSWRMGLDGVLGSSASFNVGTVTIKQHITTGLRQSISYSAEAGKFFGRKSVHFADFKHFNSQRTSFQLSSLNGVYQLQQPYATSTNEWFAHAHVSYSTSYLVLKLLPFLRNTFMVESLHASCIKVPQLNPLTELGYSISGIRAVGSIGIFTGFEKIDYKEFKIKIGILIPLPER